MKVLCVCVCVCVCVFASAFQTLGQCSVYLGPVSEELQEPNVSCHK